ncbi:bestrophin-like domain [Urbifossiella limnaea]|uniref:DUF4239 domain-containing protein n=1 Tax=Urbifossiella limnaea TaxID=2528023 RepID=A0A517XWU5_9BACT|nr:hypothetical protein [Urbifossiella limnaea]QDU21980.1 hypothetical protein ETAA1_39550 [Urbifossiella limnaea]
MGAALLDTLPLGLLFLAVVAGAALAVEGGYRLGRYRLSQTIEEKEAPVGAMVGSILALFAFVLAFTFGLAANWFEARRQAVLDEANAIGTTYLRAGLLPEPVRGESARLLREYVDVRLAMVQDGRLPEGLARTDELQRKLWAQALLGAERQPGPITALYVSSLNQVIDIHAVRVQVGVRNRIPTSIWGGLLAVGALAMAAVGYQAGIAATRRSPAMLALVLAFSGVLFMIADMDRPQQGFLTIGQQPMLDLQAGMRADAH